MLISLPKTRSQRPNSYKTHANVHLFCAILQPVVVWKNTITNIILALVCMLVIAMMFVSITNKNENNFICKP